MILYCKLDTYLNLSHASTVFIIQRNVSCMLFYTDFRFYDDIYISFETLFLYCELYQDKSSVISHEI